ncbi:efflux RND transporter periplasmic adaptor subunit [Maridesulfovibrio hydrothermalis]|uniref:Efflux transporter, RND family, MFP subunit n=1 Tax=Maridesulfovibrio hydrothermalis AM13 = DSM 14728 TaxID=1121451 RepID=L0RB39_9BACT|nr:efflux RND transporter periplasmic adaptor subunit [Maridesulfovibrio hydrothermalis]CCO23959.1 Efflux transporter, RND family, MFP subunit [Maridesulfovibrio hydrothermalis AM13 = DSM 14728]
MQRIIFFLVFLISAMPAFAAEEKQAPQMPPAHVVTAKSFAGQVAPESAYIGSVYFSEVSDVASEVSGKIVKVDVEEGDIVKKGSVLIRLSSDLLATEIRAAKAAYAEVKANYDLARRDSGRITKLFKSGSVHEGEYDSKRYKAIAMESELASSMAKLRRLQIQLSKKVIRAPFDGVVIKRTVYLGEWLARGAEVAKLGMNTSYDVVVNVPQAVAQVVKPGLKVDISVGGKEFKGDVFAVIPRGDIASRTFPVKIRIHGGSGLAQGMEARVSLPSGLASDTVVVPRDAVITLRGTTMVIAVVDGKASPVPVQVIGYKGMNAGVRGKGLVAGMDIVVKGNERLRPGQAVVIDNS